MDTDRLGRGHVKIRGGFLLLRHHAATPDAAWTTHQTRSLLLDLGDWVHPFQVLIRDRDGRFTGAFEAVLADAGVSAVRTPPRCPRRMHAPSGSCSRGRSIKR
jgi:hypothetical protein